MENIKLTEEELQRIKEIRASRQDTFLELAREKVDFKMRSVSKADALAKYKKEGNEYGQKYSRYYYECITGI
jgi:hypothetical protein